MTSRTLKLLTASTAFVAAASAANADTISTSLTATQYTSETIGAMTIVSTGSIAVSTGPAIAISSTSTTSNTITINTGATVSSTSSTVAAIVDTADNTAAVSINNSGTIAGVTAAIDLTNSSAGATLTNAGTISGSISLGDGTNDFTSTGTTRGAINGGSGQDTFEFTGATHTGALSLGAGANELTVSNSTLTGNYTGGLNNDVLSFTNSSTFTGDIALGAGGTDSIVVSNSRVNGNISTGGGTGTISMTLTNATVSGTITDAGGNGGDSITINGSNTFTAHGITGFENLNFNTDTIISGAVSGGSASSVAAGKTLTVNAASNLGAVTNSGTINISAGYDVNALTYNGNGGVLGIAVGSSSTTDVGQIILSGGNLATGTSMTINMATDAGYITSGTLYTIATGTGTQGIASLTTAGNGVYRYSTQTSGTDLVLNVGRVETDSVVTGGDSQAVANVLDGLGANATGSLETVQGQIGSQSSAAGVQAVVESLTPNIDGAGVASVNFAVDAGNQVSNRLASVRSSGYGVATGDAMANKHMWAQGFGSTVEQDDKDGARGYDANSAGASIGMDTDTLIDGVTTGAAFTYGKSSVDSNASGDASTDIDTYAATVYGSRVMDNGIFVNGQAGFGFNQYDMERTVAGVGQTTGETDGWQGTAKVETGRDYAVGGLTLTPLASLQYTYLDMDSYTETGAGGASLRVSPEAMSTVDAGVGAEASYAIALQNGGTLKPSVHAKYFYRMGDDSMATTSQFVGGGAAFDTNGVEADKSSVNVGAGLVLTTIGGTDLSVNYDADIRSSLTGHTGQLKARWAF